MNLISIYLYLQPQECILQTSSQHSSNNSMTISLLPFPLHLTLHLSKYLCILQLCCIIVGELANWHVLSLICISIDIKVCKCITFNDIFLPSVRLNGFTLPVWDWMESPKENGTVPDALWTARKPNRVLPALIFQQHLKTLNC